MKVSGVALLVQQIRRSSKHPSLSLRESMDGLIWLRMSENGYCLELTR